MALPPSFLQSPLLTMTQILPSLFDRLTTKNPSQKTRVEGIIEESIKRDLKLLLNSRKLESIIDDMSLYPEVATSVVNYGIEEYAGLVRNDINIHKVTEMIRTAILLFEPRIIPETLEVIADYELDEAQKKFNDLPHDLKQKIKEKGAFEFIIRGTICTTETPINFHTELNLSNGRIDVA